MLTNYNFTTLTPILWWIIQSSMCELTLVEVICFSCFGHHNLRMDCMDYNEVERNTVHSSCHYSNCLYNYAQDHGSCLDHGNYPCLYMVLCSCFSEVEDACSLNSNSVNRSNSVNEFLLVDKTATRMKQQ